jgi:protein-L-isoaspartate(D-aspartate) O-methyltransferase
MVRDHLAGRGITDPRILAAFRDVPREAFVPEALAAEAYADRPLPIGDGQTISQPYIVAVMVQALGLRGHERVLDVGTGSGYAAAILGKLVREVDSIERIDGLAQTARERLAKLGASNVRVFCGDGTLGLAQFAPFDAIVLAATGPRVPEALLEQLAIGGRLVMPVGNAGSTQSLVRVTRDSAIRYTEDFLADVVFVPLIGKQGFGEGNAQR